jgi:prepilin-type processing-associated H-X9-DG protein
MGNINACFADGSATGPRPTNVTLKYWVRMTLTGTDMF